MGAKTAKTPPPSLSELRERALAGEPVAEEDWTRARTLAELAELRRLAEARAAEARAEAERLAAIREVRAAVEEAAALDEDEADTALIAEAAARIIARHRRLASVVREARVRLARLGIPAGTEVEGIGWCEAGMGKPDAVILDGHLLPITAYPGRPIAQALLTACEQAGAPRRSLGPDIEIWGRRRRTPEEIAEAQARAEAARRAALERIATSMEGPDDVA